MIGQRQKATGSIHSLRLQKSQPDLSIYGRAPLLDRLRLWFIKMSWRYRYLCGFIIIGFLSICLEVFLIAKLFPERWPKPFSSALGFVAGLLFAFSMNARFNFAVPRKQFTYAFGLFSLVSVFSYALNYVATSYVQLLAWTDYPTSRFLTAGCLFMVAYWLHRRFTFRNTARNLGLAVYAAQGADLREAFERVGELCDHIHVDLVDDTMKPGAAPVDIGQIAAARSLWKWHPFCLHIMSKRPLRWLDQCLPLVDWVLVHIDGDDDIWEVITRCRRQRRKVGVTWHHTVTVAQVMPYLPHVDFVLVLGIEKPGCSGQKVTEDALENAQLFAAMSGHYGYQLIFDGGVTNENLERIAAPIVISSSHVLQAKNPVFAALSLMSGGGHAEWVS